MAEVEGTRPAERFGTLVKVGSDLDDGGEPDLVATSRGGLGSDWMCVDVFFDARALPATNISADAYVCGSWSEGVPCDTALAADVDGDGYDDLAVGCWPGTVEVWHGPLGGDRTGDLRLSGPDQVLTDDPSDPGNAWLLTLADIDGDGRNDWALGASGTNRVYVVGDAATATSLADVAYLTGRGADFSVSAVATGRDVDGDGGIDVAIGSASDDAGGHVWLVPHAVGASGPIDENGFGLGAACRDDWFGRDLAMGDFDGDGVADLAVGAPALRSESRPGRVFVFRGPVTEGMDAASAHVIVVGDEQAAQLGAGLWAGDLDGDGDDELLVGAPLASALAEGAGAVFLLDGGSGWL